MANTESTDKIAHRLKNILREFTDGSVLIGFAPNGDAMVVAYAPTQKTAIGLNGLIASLMQSGGVQIHHVESDEE